jgi:hypothetical protein
VLIALGIAVWVVGGAIIGGWGAAQLGPLSAWVAAAATFIAVYVALFQGRRAEHRAVRDREFDHRRQVTEQFAVLWSEVESLKLELMLFVAAIVDRNSRNNPSTSYTEKERAAWEVSQTRIGQVESAIFHLQVVVLQPDLHDETTAINAKFRAVKDAFGEHQQRADEPAEFVANLVTALTGLVAMRDQSIPRLQWYAPLTDAAEREANKMVAELKAEEQRLAKRPQPAKTKPEERGGGVAQQPTNSESHNE